MSIKKSLAFAVSIFLMASGLDAAVAATPVQLLTKLLTALGDANTAPNKYESSVAVAVRAEFMKLNDEQLKEILRNDPDDIFQTPYGFSLIHGWMLNKFAPHDLPFYINQNFSFSKYLLSMINAIPVATMSGQLKKSILGKFYATYAEIENDRWAYYTYMQYIPAAIAQAGTAPGTIVPDVIKAAYTLALPNADLKEHMNSIIAGRIPAEVPQAQAKLHSIMTLLLSQYNIASLLPEGREIADVQKFVEFVVEHVPALYKIPTVGLNNVNALNAEQTGERLRCFVNELMRVGAPAVAAGAVKSVNTAFTAIVQAAIEFVRQHQATAGAADKIVIPDEILPVYSEDVVVVSGLGLGSGASGLASPLKSPGKALKSGVYSPLPKDRAHIVVSGKTAFERAGVYETIRMDQLDASFVSLSFYDITDILKFFASYLDKVKGAGDNNYPDKGPSTGNWPSRTFLSEVLTMRYRILAGDFSADRNVALLFLNKCRQDIMNSMVKRGMVIKDSSGANGVARNLFGPDDSPIKPRTRDK